MIILLIGSLGQLGNEFKNFFQTNNYQFYESDLPTLDISNLDDVLEAFSEIKPEVVINCSAYNFVDKAEEDHWSPIKVNTIGVQNLAYACEKYNSFLVHFSTDYVFDGEKPSQYVEDDEPNPINFYGMSKFLGEQAIQDILDSYLIFRVSWLYGFGTQNFLIKFLHWIEETDTVRIAIDEISVPTSTLTVVNAVIKALEEGLCGLYHLTNSGYASRYEWALEIKKNLGLRINITPANAEEFKLPARRPKFSAMSNKKISDDLNIEIPSWREELERFLKICKSF